MKNWPDELRSDFLSFNHKILLVKTTGEFFPFLFKRLLLGNAMDSKCKFSLTVIIRVPAR